VGARKCRTLSHVVLEQLINNLTKDGPQFGVPCHPFWSKFADVTVKIFRHVTAHRRPSVQPGPPVSSLTRFLFSRFSLNFTAHRSTGHFLSPPRLVFPLAPRFFSSQLFFFFFSFADFSSIAVQLAFCSVLNSCFSLLTGPQVTFPPPRLVF